MVAAKVQTPTAAKAAAANRAVSTKASVQKDDFTKLLQRKKDAAEQPKQADKGQGEPSKVDASKKDDKGQDVQSAKKEEPEQKMEEAPASDDDAIQQALIQQAAVQLLLQPEGGEEPVQETVVQAEGQELQPAGVEEIHEEATAVKPEGPKEQPKAAKTKLEAKAETAESHPAKAQESAPQAQRQIGEGRQADTAGQPGSSSRAEAADERKVRQASGNTNAGQEAAYTTEASQASRPREASPAVQKTQEIPLKTTPQNLPEDLGKVLAAKTLEANRTLVVELEPASLGKLTIKLVYEGERAALSIMSANPRTLELLSQKASEIAAILEEKTGQETVIYTHQAEQGRQEYEESQKERPGQGEQQERRQEPKQDRHQSESFAQQLRLGLV